MPQCQVINQRIGPQGLRSPTNTTTAPRFPGEVLSVVSPFRKGVGSVARDRSGKTRIHVTDT